MRDSAALHARPDYVAVIGESRSIGALRRLLAPSAIEEMPAVYISACEGAAGTRRASHVRGLIIAHRQVWEEARRRSARFVLVLESDAIASSPHAAESIGKAVRESRDVTYLGWCYGQSRAAPPLCAHAYMLSSKAVDAMLSAVPRLGCLGRQSLPPLDHIMRGVIMSGGLSWARAENPPGAPAHWTSGAFHQEGEEDPDS